MKRWYVLYTKPFKERLVSDFVENKGYETYLPIVQIRKKGKRKCVPFFSCYLFVRMNGWLDLSSIRWTPGLKKIVSFGGRPATVPDEIIGLIRQRLAQVKESGYWVPRFKQGERVVIESGPFADLEALFEGILSSQDRARILVDLLGRWTPCEIDIDCLSKVG